MNSQKYLLKTHSTIKLHTTKKLLGTYSKLRRKGTIEAKQTKDPVKSGGGGRLRITKPDLIKY